MSFRSGYLDAYLNEMISLNVKFYRQLRRLFNEFYIAVYKLHNRDIVNSFPGGSDDVFCPYMYIFEDFQNLHKSRRTDTRAIQTNGIILHTSKLFSFLWHFSYIITGGEPSSPRRHPPSDENLTFLLFQFRFCDCVPSLFLIKPSSSL